MTVALNFIPIYNYCIEFHPIFLLWRIGVLRFHFYVGWLRMIKWSICFPRLSFIFYLISFIGEKLSFSQWHVRLGYSQLRTIKNIILTFQLPYVFNSVSDNKCTSYFLSKKAYITLPSTFNNSHPLDVIYFDV